MKDQILYFLGEASELTGLGIKTINLINSRIVKIGTVIPPNSWG